ncbi:10440_t:CDS:2 [Scutellospora calospora]|uniref:10440_t:CDS:1 n=1 Tax=Scutellospora calospora TaxID=85575 RepID=A0ACA9MTB5_9GLOM|nr:10440_t:CDS:2 [Scutellospora calospora]
MKNITNNKIMNGNETSNDSFLINESESSIQTELSNNTRRPLSNIWDKFNVINNRLGKHKGTSCRYCPHTWVQRRAQEIKSHLAMKCRRRVSREVRIRVLRDLQSKFSKSTTPKKKKSDYSQLFLNAYYDTKEAIDKAKETRANQTLIKWIVCSGISFSAFDNPFFENYTKLLNSGYDPPKHTILASSILDAEAVNIIIKVENELSKAKNLTLCNSYSASAALREEIIHFLTLGRNLKSTTKTWCNFLEPGIYKNYVLKKVLEIWKKLGSGRISADLLKTQMSLYKNQESPYDDEFIISANIVTNW